MRDLCESVTGAVIGVPIGAQCELCYLNYFRVFISFYSVNSFWSLLATVQLTILDFWTDGQFD